MPLFDLQQLAKDRRQLDAKIQAAVRNARRRRETWKAIGGALGVTRQAAWDRYSKDDGSGR
jgi:ATP-dependent Clp protease ATP-binding subunit ClpX